jgi:hypothetical protein
MGESLFFVVQFVVILNVRRVPARGTYPDRAAYLSLLNDFA